MTTIGTFLYTALKGRLLGQDRYGNKYYEARVEKTASGKKKRWVIYNGIVEPTKVPPEWHGWLHYTSDLLPNPQTPVQQAWSKEPVPNLTGTKLAYVPPGHVNRGGERASTIADYDAWKP